VAARQHALSKRPRLLHSVTDGVARIFDFNGTLSHRTRTRSAEEDMALAWREVYGGLPRRYSQASPGSQIPSPGEPPDSSISTSTPLQGPNSLTQATLFDASEFSEASDEMGYRGPTACAAAGITYRQLDYWARTGLVVPSIRSAHGSGAQRLYGFRDILELKVVKRLLDTGMSIQQIRVAVQHLRDRGTENLAQVTLMSDGVSVYECTSPDEVVDILAGGQGVFGIALGRVWQEVAGELADVPAVRITGNSATSQGIINVGSMDISQGAGQEQQDAERAG
jgi:DNA-binding transcriptional MerR regulator